MGVVTRFTTYVWKDSIVLRIIILVVMTGFGISGPSFTQAQTGTSVSSRSTAIISPSQSSQEILLEQGQTIRIIVTNITSAMEFGVIQAHSYLRNVTISYNSTLSPSFYTRGTNVGLVVIFGGMEAIATEFSVYLMNDVVNTSIEVLLVLRTYDSNAPVPGGCSLVERIQTAPYLPTRYTESMLSVDYPLASWPLNVRPPTCDRSPLQYDLFQYYLPERDFTKKTMFQSILLMTDWKSIEANGRKITFYGSPVNAIKFANYPGTGRIVVVIARGLTSSAAYVPTLSYGCDPLSVSADSEIKSCENLRSTGAKLLSASLIFVGLFLTFCGHRFYKSQLFLLGLCIASFVSYIVLILTVHVGDAASIMMSIGVGAVGGASLLVMWARWGSPLLPILLSCLLLGTLFSSTITYTPLADWAIMKDDTTFCLAFLSLLLLVPPLLLSFTRVASVVCTAVIGSFLFIFPLDLYLGSNLRYIILNVIRRATVKSFGVAIIDPIFETTDLIMTVVWGVLAVTGTLFQLWREKGRAPFPPAPIWPSRRRRTVSNSVTDETTPLTA